MAALPPTTAKVNSGEITDSLLEVGWDKVFNQLPQMWTYSKKYHSIFLWFSRNSSIQVVDYSVHRSLWH